VCHILTYACNFLCGRTQYRAKNIRQHNTAGHTRWIGFRRRSITHLIKFCIYWFSLWYKFLVHYALRVETKFQHELDSGPSEFRFLWARGFLTKAFRTLSRCFAVIGNIPLLSPLIILLKNVCFGHRDNYLTRYDPIFPLLRCQGVWNRTYTQFSLSQNLFQNPKNYSLLDVQRYCCHFWFDSTVIFDEISNIRNIYISPSRFWTLTFRVIFTSFLPSRNREYPQNTFDRFTASFSKAFCMNSRDSVVDGPALSNLSWQLSVHFVSRCGRTRLDKMAS